MRWSAIRSEAVADAGPCWRLACGRRRAARGDEARGGGGEAAIRASPTTTIKLGGSYPFSGPASAYRSSPRARKAHFKWVNAKGGVNGRKIEFVTLDDAYEPPRAVQNARRLIQQEKVFALFNTLGTPNNLAIWDYVNQQKVPHVFVATGASAWGADVEGHPWTIGWQPDYVTEAQVYADYLKKEKPDAKVAVLYQNDAFGKDLLGGFKEAIKGTDIEIVAEESYEVTDPTVASQMSKLASLGRRHVPQHHDAEVLGAGDRARSPRSAGRRCTSSTTSARRRSSSSSRSASRTPRASSRRRTSRIPRIRVGRRPGDGGVQGRARRSTRPRPNRRGPVPRLRLGGRARRWSRR